LEAPFDCKQISRFSEIYLCISCRSWSSIYRKDRRLRLSLWINSLLNNRILPRKNRGICFYRIFGEKQIGLNP
jgi:hypothetical protein